MEKQRNKPTLTVEVSGLRLKIIRVGKSPRLAYRETPMRTPRIHSHFTYEVFFVTEGHLEIVTETQRMTCERKIIIIPPHVFHWIDNTKCDKPFKLFTFWPRQEQNEVFFVREKAWGTSVKYVDDQYTEKRLGK